MRNQWLSHMSLKKGGCWWRGYQSVHNFLIAIGQVQMVIRLCRNYFLAQLKPLGFLFATVTLVVCPLKENSQQYKLIALVYLMLGRIVSHSTHNFLPWTFILRTCDCGKVSNCRHNRRENEEERRSPEECQKLLGSKVNIKDFISLVVQQPVILEA